MVMQTLPSYQLQEQIVIEGEDRNSGARFSIVTAVTYNPLEKTTEQAIIHSFECRAQSFEELAVQQGWSNAYWTYHNHGGTILV